jgi:hypothetical protein
MIYLTNHASFLGEKMTSTPTKKVQIEIETSDKSLLSDLRCENIPDLFLSERRKTCDEPGLISPLLIVVINTSSIVALDVFSTWLCDRFIKKNPDKIIINNIEIVDGQQILVIMDRYILQIEQGE